MLAVFLASIVAWGRRGNSQLRENWVVGRGSMTTTAMVKEIFNGICIGVLGLTGFECMAILYLLDLLEFLTSIVGTPSYVSSVKPGRFPMILRNLHYPAIFLNFLAMLFLLALVPLDTILGGANVLSVLATVVRIHRHAVSTFLTH